jgi:adenosine deaminase
VHALTVQVGRDLAAHRVRYAEVTVTPWSSVRRGIPAEAFCEAIEAARVEVRRDTGTELAWCFDVPGELGVPAADATLDIALRCRPDGLVSFGLGGPEVGVPRRQFTRHFAEARAAGLHTVPHAGESSGSGAIWDAVRALGAERIGHGIAAAVDPLLMAYLRDAGIVLEVCPTSNVATKSVPSLAEHPLPTLVAAGVLVTINSDDPPMFSTTLNQEYLIAADLLGLDQRGLADLARAAVDASFMPPDARRHLCAEIDDYLIGTLDRRPHGGGRAIVRETGPGAAGCR